MLLPALFLTLGTSPGMAAAHHNMSGDAWTAGMTMLLWYWILWYQMISQLLVSVTRDYECLMLAMILTLLHPIWGSLNPLNTKFFELHFTYLPKLLLLWIKSFFGFFLVGIPGPDLFIYLCVCMCFRQRYFYIYFFLSPYQSNTRSAKRTIALSFSFIGHNFNYSNNCALRVFG